MAITLLSSSNITIMGLTLKDSGGDGIYIDNSGESKFDRNIYIKDCWSDNNYRQGISIISADGLLIEDCAFTNTWGTRPESGVDIEPESSYHVVRNIVFRNCSFRGNNGAQIKFTGQFYYSDVSDIPDISIRFENCYATGPNNGINVKNIYDNGPNGLIEFVDCLVENVEDHGLFLFNKSADRALVRFTNCTWRNIGTTPLFIYARTNETVKRLGGVEFIDCFVEDNEDRNFLTAYSLWGIYDITGNITVYNPHGVSTIMARQQEGIDLEITEAETPLLVE